MLFISPVIQHVTILLDNCWYSRLMALDVIIIIYYYLILIDFNLILTGSVAANKTHSVYLRNICYVIYNSYM